MKIDIKVAAPYLVMICGFAMTWGMWSERLSAVETKVDKITQMQTDMLLLKKRLCGWKHT